MNRIRSTRWLGPLALLILAACKSGSPSGPEPPPPPPGQPRIVFLVDHPDTPNRSERLIRDRIRTLGVPIALIDDDAFVSSDTVGCRMVLMSKTVEDSLIRDKLKGCPCGILFWEENQQQLGMLATVANDGSDGAFWHSIGDSIWVRPEAPERFRAQLSGSVQFYTERLDISYGRRQDVPASATVVAEFQTADNHKVIYFYERGDQLADGTVAAGKRFFFGLHRDTFQRLTPQGLSLFDAAVAWTLEE